MIEGIGVDIVSVERIERVYKKFGTKFLERVFADVEINYSFRHANPFVYLAARFAVKEAVLKALKKPEGLRLKDIELHHNKDGSPEVRLPDRFNKKILVSVSHEKTQAVAFVIVTEK